MPDLWGLASVANKFALYLGVLVSVGTVLAAIVLRFEIARRLAMGFAVLGIAATLFAVSLAGAALTGDASGMTDPVMIGLLWSTPVGTAVSTRIAGLVLLIVGLVFGGRLGLGLTLIGGLLALWSFSLVGHVPDRGRLLLQLILLFHLTAVSIWIGVLAPLKALSQEPGSCMRAADLGRRFGKVAAVFVPLLVMAGGYMGFAIVGSLSALLGTGYGQTLVLKVVFVAAILALAAANKLRFVPQMSTGDQNAASHLARSISLEWVVINLILLTTAVLTSVQTLPS